MKVVDTPGVDGRHHPVVYVIAAAVFVFPITSVTVAHGATTIFSILFLMSLYYGWSGWHGLRVWERRVLIGFTLFALAIALSLVHAERFHEGISKYSKYLRFAAFTPMYLMMRRWNTDFSRPLIAGLMLGVLAMFGLAIYQHFWLDIPRPGGARNPIRFGEMVVATGLVLTVAVITRPAHRWHLLIGALGIGAALYTSYLNQTRGAQLAVPFFILLMLGYYHRRMTRGGWALALFGIVLTVGVAAHPASRVHQHFAQGIDELRTFFQDHNAAAGSSWGLRLSMAYTSWEIFSESPWLGTGLADYKPDATRLMRNQETLTQDPLVATSPHSVYMHVLAISGLTGLTTLLIGVFGLPMGAFARYWQADHAGHRFCMLSGLSVASAFAIYGISNTWTEFNNPISIYLLFLLVLLSGLAARVRGDKSPSDLTISS